MYVEIFLMYFIKKKKTFKKISSKILITHIVFNQ